MQPWFSTIWRKDVFRRRWLYGLRRFACYGGERYAKEGRTKGHTEHPAGAGAAGTHFGYPPLQESYESLLDVSGNGIIGYIEIPTIKCSLPIYHGTDEAILQIAVGHIEGTSLPVGGSGTHCVLSGHRGLPSARLFTDLDKMVVGDTFMMRVLDETLTYEVDQIRIVLPNEMDDLEIEEGKDYCTLVTCTPYGINSHRLLVRGHRIENQVEAQDIRVTSDAIQIEPLIVAPIVALPMLLALLIILLVSGTKKPVGGKKNEKTE